MKYTLTRSLRGLGALRAPTSSWRPFGSFDFILRALWALRPCDPRTVDQHQHLLVHLYVYDACIRTAVMHVSVMHESMMHEYMMHVSMMHVSIMHVSMMHVSMMHVSMMHVSMMLVSMMRFHDVYIPDACFQDAYINVSMMHVSRMCMSMMHVSMMHVSRMLITIAIQIVFHEEKHKTRICHLNPVLSAAVRILKTRI